MGNGSPSHSALPDSHNVGCCSDCASAHLGRGRISASTLASDLCDHCPQPWGGGTCCESTAKFRDWICGDARSGRLKICLEHLCAPWFSDFGVCSAGNCSAFMVDTSL